MSQPPAPVDAPLAVPGERDFELAGMPMRFGKYTLIRKLATGGMAEIFLAIQKSVAGFEKLIVIKRILPPLNHDRAFVEMLLHEARVAATLSHPNIVQIFDVGHAEGQFFIAMEHVHGEDLRSIVRQMKKKGLLEFPVEHAIAITLGMCAGLAYAHDRRDLDGTPLNIVHRDISPQNVVVTFTGDVKIVDFGIAKSDARSGEATKSGKLKGKVPYMSPEQARGEPVDARSDVFSTGVMLFELTTGKRLFKGASEYETLKLICEREYPRPSDVLADYPRDLEDIVMKALAKDRDDRYQTAREMQAALEGYVRHNQIAVSNVALHQFMQSLFEEKLAAQKDALLQGKQLADIIEMQHAVTASAELAAVDTSGMRLLVSATQSMPAASHTVTELAIPSRRRKKRLTAAGGLAMAAVLGGGVAVFALRGATGAPTTTNATETLASRGSLAIESDPPGASIWVNGDLRAETTPATIGSLPASVPIDVKLTKEGFEHGKQRVSLKAGETNRVRLVMRKGALVLDVKVSPTAASPAFALDGKPVVGPRIEGVTSGIAHKLVISAPGFAEQTVSVSGGPLETKVVEVALDKAAVRAAHGSSGASHGPSPGSTGQGGNPEAVPAQFGKLNVGASNGWCNVTVDGAPRGATPVAGIELAAGAHAVTCTTADGKTMSANVSVQGDGTTTRYKFAL
jgi:serine/threonine protein kinase